MTGFGVGLLPAVRPPWVETGRSPSGRYTITNNVTGRRRLQWRGRPPLVPSDAILLVSVQDHLESLESLVIPCRQPRFAGACRCGPLKTAPVTTAANCATPVT